jgi:hypothetical protein
VVTGVNFPSGEDVRADAAAVNERADDRAAGLALDDRAPLAQSHRSAAHAPDHEVVIDELVEVDPSTTTVAPRDAGVRPGNDERGNSHAAQAAARLRPGLLLAWFGMGDAHAVEPDIVLGTAGGCVADPQPDQDREAVMGDQSPALPVGEHGHGHHACLRDPQVFAGEHEPAGCWLQQRRGIGEVVKRGGLQHVRHPRPGSFSLKLTRPLVAVRTSVIANRLSGATAVGATTV